MSKDLNTNKAIVELFKTGKSPRDIYLTKGLSGGL